MNIFKEAYEIEKKYFDDMGEKNYLELNSARSVVMTEFLRIHGLSEQYKAFWKKFIEMIESEVKNR